MGEQAQAPRLVVPVDEGKLRVFLGLRPRAEVEAEAQKQNQARERSRLDKVRNREYAEYLDRGESL